MANVSITTDKPDGTKNNFDCSIDEYVNMQRAIYGEQTPTRNTPPAVEQQVIKPAEPQYTTEVLPPQTSVAPVPVSPYMQYAEFEKQLAAAGLRIVYTPNGPQICSSTSPSFEALRTRSVYGNCDGWSGNYAKPNLVTWLGPNAQMEIMRCQMDPNRMLRWAAGIGIAGIGVGILGSILYLTIKARATSNVD